MRDLNEFDHMVEKKAVDADQYLNEQAGQEEQTKGDTTTTAEFEPFPVDALPGVLAEFVKQAAISIGCDETLVMNPLLAALAGAIGNTRQIVIKSDWREPAILWTCSIADSGSRKSPPFRLVKAFFNKIERQAQLSYEHAESQYKGDLARYKTDLTKWSKNGLGTLPEEPTEPSKTRYVINDATTEAVTHCLGGNSRGLILMRDELSGWFNAFGQYKNGDADSPFWLECFESGTYSVDRRGIKKPIYVSRCSVSVTGTTQPATLMRFIGNRVAVENGMLPRFLLAYPPEQPTQWANQVIDPDLTKVVQTLFDELLSLGFYLDSSGTEHPNEIHLTSDTRNLFREMFNQYGTEKLQLPSDLKSVWSKMPGKIARIALVFHMVHSVTGEKVDSDRIDAETMQSAITIGRWYANETSRIYSLLCCESENSELREQREILDVIRDLGRSATIRDIYRRKGKYRDDDNKQRLEEILRSLCKKGILRTETKDTGGRPTETFFFVGTVGHGTEASKNTGNNDLSSNVQPSQAENTNFEQPLGGVPLKRTAPKAKPDQESKKEEPRHEQTTLFD